MFEISELAIGTHKVSWQRPSEIWDLFYSNGVAFKSTAEVSIKRRDTRKKHFLRKYSLYNLHQRRVYRRAVPEYSFSPCNL